MESPTGSSRRLSSAAAAAVEMRGMSSASTVLGNTPPVTTTTTTSSSSPASDPRQQYQRQGYPESQNSTMLPNYRMNTHQSQQQQQQQQQQYHHHHNSNNMSTCSSSNDASLPRPLYPENTTELPEEVLSYFEHWASPTEVLQLRSMCTDIVNIYKNKEMSLRRELEELRKERELLMREAQDTKKLRHLYKTATVEYEKSQKERNQWEEEREIMRLKLQRLSVDNQRLHQAVGKGGGRTSTLQLARVGVPPILRSPGNIATSTGAAVTFTNTTVPITGSTIATPSPTSSSTTRHMHEQRIANQQQQYQQQHKQRQHNQHQQQPRQTDFESGSGINSGTIPSPSHNSNNNNNNNSNSSTEGDYYYYYNNNNIHSSSGAGCSSSIGSNNISISQERSEALREQLRLIEELHRRSMEYDELSSRFHFAQTVWDMTATRSEHRLLQLTAANETLRAQLRQARAAAEDATGLHHTVSAQLQECRVAADNAVSALQTANNSEQTRVEEGRRHTQECIAALKATHAEEIAQMQRQLQLTMNDVAHTRESLLAAQQKQHEQAETQRQALLTDVRALEQKCGEALNAQQAAQTALAEAVSSFKQKEQQYEREIQQLQLAQQKCEREKEEESTTLRSVREEQAKLTERLHSTETELHTLRSRLRTTLEQLQQHEEIEEELTLTRMRADEAELEVRTQESYYTEQMRLQQTALTDLQKQRDEEVRRFGHTIERLQRRCEAGKIRLAAAVKGITQSETGTTTRPSRKTRKTSTATEKEEKKLSCAPGEEQKEKEKGKRGTQGGESNRNNGADAVTLLQQSADLAATLARTIRREAFAT